MRRALKLWRVWLAMVVFALAIGLLIASLKSACWVVAARSGVIAATNPRGALWVYWGSKRDAAAETIVYDTEGMAYVVTHQPDGTSSVQGVPMKRRGALPAVWAHRTVPPPGGPRFQGYSILVSLWWTAGGGTLVSAWLVWGAWRRRSRSGCWACGYSRVGLAADAACPECGLLGLSLIHI